MFSYLGQCKPPHGRHSSQAEHEWLGKSEWNRSRGGLISNSDGQWIMGFSRNLGKVSILAAGLWAL